MIDVSLNTINRFVTSFILQMLRARNSAHILSFILFILFYQNIYVFCYLFFLVHNKFLFADYFEMFRSTYSIKWFTAVKNLVQNRGLAAGLPELTKVKYINNKLINYFIRSKHENTFTYISFS